MTLKLNHRKRKPFKIAEDKQRVPIFRALVYISKFFKCLTLFTMGEASLYPFYILLSSTRKRVMLQERHFEGYLQFLYSSRGSRKSCYIVYCSTLNTDFHLFIHSHGIYQLRILILYLIHLLYVYLKSII